MTDEHNRLFPLGGHIIINSTITQQPYIDETYFCHIFETKKDANAFVNNVAHTEYSDRQDFDRSHFITLLYTKGFQGLVLHPRDKEAISIPISESDAKPSYYNNYLSGQLLQLKQTKGKRYLKAIRTAKFIVPTKLNKREKGTLPIINYSLGKIHERKYLIIFSDIKKFDFWNEQQNKQWQALEIDMSMLNKLRQENGIIIDPQHSIIALSDDLLKQVCD